MLIRTCAIWKFRKDLQANYQRCHIKPTMMGASKAEDLVSCGTLTVDSQTLQSHMFEKRGTSLISPANRVV